MPEVLLHFIIPFIVLSICGLSIKRSFLLASFAVLPDLDVLFHVHRSFTHSIPIILLICSPVIIITFLKNSKWFYDSLIATLVIVSHPFLDVFHMFTPILYPIYNNPIHIIVKLTTDLYYLSQIHFTFEIQRSSILFPRISESADGVIFSSLGFAMTIVFLLGITYINRQRNNKSL